MSFKVTFVGSGDECGIPAPFCNCRICRSARQNPAECRSRAGILLDEDTVLDWDVDFIQKRYSEGKTNMLTFRHLLFCNQGPDFSFITCHYHYQRFCQLPEERMTIYGNPNVFRSIIQMIPPFYSKLKNRDFNFWNAANIDFVNQSDRKTIDAGIQRITPVLTDSKRQYYAYIIERDGKVMLFIRQPGALDPEAFEFLKQNRSVYDLVVMDRRVRRSGKEAVELFDIFARKSGCIRIITGFSHYERFDAEECDRLYTPHGIIAASDNMEVAL